MQELRDPGKQVLQALPKRSLLQSISRSNFTLHILPVTRFDTCNACFGECAAPYDLVVPDEVVGSARIVPVPDRGVQTHCVAVSRQLPARLRKRRHHFLPAAAWTQMQRRLEALTDVKHARHQRGWCELNELGANVHSAPSTQGLRVIAPKLTTNDNSCELKLSR